jgi:hypothetical protein
MSNLWIRRFDEHIQALGFEMAPVAWDLAKYPWKSDIERYAVLDDLVKNER